MEYHKKPMWQSLIKKIHKILDPLHENEDQLGRFDLDIIEKAVIRDTIKSLERELARLKEPFVINGLESAVITLFYLRRKDVTRDLWLLEISSFTEHQVHNRRGIQCSRFDSRPNLISAARAESPSDYPIASMSGFGSDPEAAMMAKWSFEVLPKVSEEVIEASKGLLDLKVNGIAYNKIAAYLLYKAPVIISAEMLNDQLCELFGFNPECKKDKAKVRILKSKAKYQWLKRVTSEQAEAYIEALFDRKPPKKQRPKFGRQLRKIWLKGDQDTPSATLREGVDQFTDQEKRKITNDHLEYLKKWPQKHPKPGPSKRVKSAINNRPKKRTS